MLSTFRYRYAWPHLEECRDLSIRAEGCYLTVQHPTGNRRRHRHRHSRAYRMRHQLMSCLKLHTYVIFLPLEQHCSAPRDMPNARRRGDLADVVDVASCMCAYIPIPDGENYASEMSRLAGERKWQLNYSWTEPNSYLAPCIIFGDARYGTAVCIRLRDCILIIIFIPCSEGLKRATHLCRYRARSFW